MLQNRCVAPHSNASLGQQRFTHRHRGSCVHLCCPGAERGFGIIEIAGEPPCRDGVCTDDPAASYDPAKMLAAIDEGAGAFEGMDVDAFLAEILEAREQDTPTHRF